MTNTYTVCVICPHCAGASYAPLDAALGTGFVCEECGRYVRLPAASKMELRGISARLRAMERPGLRGDCPRVALMDDM